MIRDALDLAKETQGAFDPTVGPLMELWGVHGARRTELPSDALLNDVQKRVGYAKVRLDLNDTAGQIDLGGTQLDLSAIAKGTGVPRYLLQSRLNPIASRQGLSAPPYR